MQKCDIVSRHGREIQCQKCDNLYHLKCAGLSKTAYIPTTPWYCYQCNEEIFPFNTITPKKILSLSYNSNLLDRHPNRFRRLHIPQIVDSKKSNFSLHCKVCTKTVSQPNSAIPCQTCVCLIHRTCSNLKDKDWSTTLISGNALIVPLNLPSGHVQKVVVAEGPLWHILLTNSKEDFILLKWLNI